MKLVLYIVTSYSPELIHYMKKKKMNISLFFVLGFLGDQVVITAIGVENTDAESTETIEERDPLRRGRTHEREVDQDVQTDSPEGEKYSPDSSEGEQYSPNSSEDEEFRGERDTSLSHRSVSDYPDDGELYSPREDVDKMSPNLKDDSTGLDDNMMEDAEADDSALRGDRETELEPDSPETPLGDSTEEVNIDPSDRQEESTGLDKEMVEFPEAGDHPAHRGARETGDGPVREIDPVEESTEEANDDLSGRSPNVVSSISQAADTASEEVISATRDSEEPKKERRDESTSVAEPRNDAEETRPGSIQAEIPSPNAVNENLHVHKAEPISSVTEDEEKELHPEAQHVGISPHVQDGGKPVSVETQYFEEKMLNVERNRLLNDPLTRVFDELFGDSLEWFPSQGDNSGPKDKFSILVNCNNKQDDSDYKVNLVTTLCPFLRSDADNACGTIRRASYQFDDGKKLCSSDCAPHLNAVLEALRRRENLIHRHDMAVFRDIANQFLLQFAGICRLGSSPRLET